MHAHTYKIYVPINWNPVVDAQPRPHHHEYCKFVLPIHLVSEQIMGEYKLLTRFILSKRNEPAKINLVRCCIWR